MKNRVYDNRELSWLKFDLRVLEEAEDTGTPLMERMLFQSIYSSNLDEFFMVRVGSIYDASLVDDYHKDNKTKMRPSEQLSAIFKNVRELVPRKDESYKKICKALEAKGVRHKSIKELTVKELEFLEAYYAYEIRPFISPLIIDKRHPFPFLENKGIYVAARLVSKSGFSLGMISCTDKFKRVICLPERDDRNVSFVLVEDVISYYAASAFPGYKLEEKAIMRVTRNADIDVDESFDRELDFRQNMSQLIKMRKRLCPVRLQLSKQVSDQLLKELTSRLELSKKQVFVEKSPLDMSFVGDIMDKTAGRSELFFEPKQPQPSRMVDEKRPMIPQIDEHDLFLSYPYESIQPFIRLLDEAAADPEVVSIKMTLYRVAKNSRIIKALCTAAENGKEVTVLVELRARFDEENNIGWSKLLEESGCRVMYGPQGLKVHSKLCLITRRTGEGVKHTVQIGTGNYNEKTAKLYTDLCLMTSNETMAADAENVFRTLSLGELVRETKSLMVAPYCLQNKVLELMDNEIAVARAGGEGYVGAKLNALTDKVIIDKLIECSQAGVKVDLVIRGISCLVAGVPGVTENIHIRSIVGRYLEHARIYIFGCGVRRSVYISSADYMTRNTTRRVEVAAPILDEKIRARVIGIFETQLEDNCKARVMQPDGTYECLTPEGEPAVMAQSRLFAEAYANRPLEVKKKPEAMATEPDVTEKTEKPEPVEQEPVPEEPKPVTEPAAAPQDDAPKEEPAAVQETAEKEPEPQAEEKSVKKNKASGAGSSGSSGGKSKKKTKNKKK